MAVLIIAAMDDDEARSAMRLLLFDGEVAPELRMRVTELMRMRGVDWEGISDAGAALSMMPDADALLDGMMVGERQLVRYANDVLEQDYISALPVLALTWAIYRQRRGGRRAVGAVRNGIGGAGLPLFDDARPAGAWNASRGGLDAPRDGWYYVNRIAGVFARMEGKQG